MKMKCPVCKSACTVTDNICKVCGFTELNVEFINMEEAQAWERSVLRPCRALWTASQSMYQTALKKYQNLEKQYNGTQPRSTMVPPPLNPALAKVSRTSEWNFDDLVAHPLYAKCSYVGGVSVCEIYNIRGEGNSQNYKILFMVKVLSTKTGKSERVHFKWRVKDKDGVVALTGDWIKDGLLPGDATRGEISLNNVGKHDYTIDFIDV